MPSLQRGTHLLELHGKPAWEPGLELDFCLFFAHFHYFIMVFKWCFIKWTSSALRNVQISTNNVATPLSLTTSPEFHFSVISSFHFFTSHHKLPNTPWQLPPYFQNPPTILQPFYQDLYSSLDSFLFINIAFTFLPFFVVIVIVFMGHQEGMEVKLQNLDDISYVSEMAKNGLGSFFFFHEYNICIRHCSDLCHSFIFSLALILTIQQS